MLMPSIFGENLFDDDWMNFPFNDEFWGKKNPLYGKHAQNMMKTDIRETDGSYELDVDLPGFKKDEIQVQLKDGYLVLSAAKGLDKDEKDKEGNYIRRERYAGSMCRSFYVGDAVSEEDIHAKYEDGILKLSVPKKAPEKIEKDGYDEIKFVVNTKSKMEKILNFESYKPIFIQPQNEKDKPNFENLNFCITFVKNHPKFILSVQLHKFLGVE